MIRRLLCLLLELVNREPAWVRMWDDIHLPGDEDED